jgi:hypothetical protein
MCRRGRSFRSACALTEICLRILAIDPDYIHIPGEVHYDEDLISRGGSTGKGRACDLMQRSNLVNFWRELGELVDDSVTLGLFGVILEATGLCAHKIWRSAVFVSAIISQRPSNVEGFREAWMLVISAEARIIDLFGG